MPPRLGDLAPACALVDRGLRVVVPKRLRVNDDLFFGAEDRGVDSAELLALIRDEALAWSPEVKLGLAGVELVFACRGDGIAISGGTVTDVGHPVAVVGLVVPRVRRRITLVSHSLACIGKPIAVVGQACTLVGCAIALVGECLSAHQSGVTVADSGVGCRRALISDASRIGEGLGGFVFVSGVSQLEAGCVLVEQLGAALQRCRTPMPFASYRIARQLLMAFCGGAGALEPLAGVLGEPLRALGARVMVVWA